MIRVVGKIDPLAAIWLRERGATLKRVQFPTLVHQVVLVDLPERLVFSSLERTFTIADTRAFFSDPSIEGQLHSDESQACMALRFPGGQERLPAIEGGILFPLLEITGYSEAACLQGLKAVIARQSYVPEQLCQELPGWLKIWKEKGGHLHASEGKLPVEPEQCVRDFHWAVTDFLESSKS